jgi:hypothetical protein
VALQGQRLILRCDYYNSKNYLLPVLGALGIKIGSFSGVSSAVISGSGSGNCSGSGLGSGLGVIATGSCLSLTEKRVLFIVLIS